MYCDLRANLRRVLTTAVKVLAAVIKTDSATFPLQEQVGCHSLDSLVEDGLDQIIVTLGIHIPSNVSDNVACSSCNHSL